MKKSPIPEEIAVVPEPSQDRLSERELVDYCHHREKLIRWMIDLGKNPDQAEGYSTSTVRRRATNLDFFYRHVWEEEGGYTTGITTDHADEFIRELAHGDFSDSHRSNLQKTLRMYFRFRNEEWEPEIVFGSGKQTAPRDYLTDEERRAIREAALEYGSVPHYNSLEPSERTEWKRHLARRFGMPTEEIGKEEFDRANGWKIPSLVWVSLDAALRPIEVERAKPSWVDVENAAIRIPAEDAAKNHENWTVALRESTAEMLEQWIEERELYKKYDDSDHLWLTREGNPYQSTALKYVLRKLADVANIPTENRSLTWYSIRHSTGTYLSREEGLAAAQTQLRHRSARTTMKYDQAPAEDRRDALNRMG